MIRRITIISVFLIGGLLLPCGAVRAYDLTITGNASAQVFFSPHGGATQAILDIITKSRSEILIQAYSFRSPALAEALIAAKKRGVQVELVMDKSERQEGLTPPTLMSNAGIPVYLDGSHAMANNRVMVVDKKIIITGSFNFNTASEQMNAENLLILHSRELAALYRTNWLDHRKHAEPF